MDEKNKELTKEAEKFFKDYFDSRAQSIEESEKSSNVNGAALIYERIRVAMEYQEDHLIFKNAISRIIRRKYTLLPSISKETLTGDLLRELSWANYINTASFEDDKRKQIQDIIEKYLIILRNLSTGLYSKMDLQRKVIDWMGCEIEDFINPKEENNALIDFATGIIEQKLNVNTKKISVEDNRVLIKMTVYGLVFKPDLSLIEYYLLNQIYPDWQQFDKEESKKFGRCFEPYYNKVVKFINHPFKNNYLHYIRGIIPPFIVIRSTLASENMLPKTLKENPELFESEALNVYKSLVVNAKTKVLRGTFRALIFVFLTKIILAFILEIPFDRYWNGSINYLSLVINVSAPPLLMFISGAFTKSPPAKNSKLISKAIGQILYENYIGKNKIDLIKKRRNSFAIFNLLYGFFNVAVLGVVVWLLFYVGFNILSVCLFFLFVSVVSFFSFRIRNVALELAMERFGDDAITGAVEFVFLPFIKIGKCISSQFASFNPLILVVDLLIEAPLKTIIRILGLWKGFINSKKEELEY